MSIIMDVPEAFSTAYKLGKVVKYGTILKDANTGKIVAHLAESKNLINLVSSIPSNPTQIATGLVSSVSSLAANYQLYNQNIKLDQQSIKIDSLLDQVKNLTGLAQFTAVVSSVGAIASVATFALCAVKFKAIDNRLNTIEKKVDGMIEKLESIQSNNDKREIRTHLTGIKSSFDYLIPSASKSKIEDIQRDLSRGFSGLNIFLKDKIYANPTLIDLDDVNFLYNVLTIAAMGEFRGFIILDDTQGAKHILHQRKSDLRDLKKSLIYISKALCSDENKLTNSQLNDKKEQFKSLVNNVTDCYADFDSQGIIVSEYLDKRKIRLKHYYEDMENEDTNDAIVVIPHLHSSKLK
jgi:hypothetical protein